MKDFNFSLRSTSNYIVTLISKNILEGGTELDDDMHDRYKKR